MSRRLAAEDADPLPMWPLPVLAVMAGAFFALASLLRAGDDAIVEPPE